MTDLEIAQESAVRVHQSLMALAQIAPGPPASYAGVVIVQAGVSGALVNLGNAVVEALRGVADHLSSQGKCDCGNDHYVEDVDAVTGRDRTFVFYGDTDVVSGTVQSIAEVCMETFPKEDNVIIILFRRLAATGQLCDESPAVFSTFKAEKLIPALRTFADRSETALEAAGALNLPLRAVKTSDLPS